MIDKLGRIWKGAASGLVEILSQHFPRETEMPKTSVRIAGVPGKIKIEQIQVFLFCLELIVSSIGDNVINEQAGCSISFDYPV
jgi:hypothetical protein